MKLLYVLILFLLPVLFHCKQEKELQVVAEAWTLIERHNGYRLMDQEWIPCVWLIWENKNHVRHSEYRHDDAGQWVIGTVIYNRVPR